MSTSSYKKQNIGNRANRLLERVTQMAHERALFPLVSGEAENLNFHSYLQLCNVIYMLRPSKVEESCWKERLSIESTLPLESFMDRMSYDLFLKVKELSLFTQNKKLIDKTEMFCWQQIKT